MELAAAALFNVACFLAITTLLVTVHEVGHYLMARMTGLRVEVFSIGLGPEIVGRTDRAGTRWKLGLVPLGGYIRMFGEQSGPRPDGTPSAEAYGAPRPLLFEEASLGRRAAVAAAGPAANFALSFVVLAVLLLIVGRLASVVASLP